MAFTDVNIGAAPDDGTGDPLRTAFQKINGNFADAQVQINAKADSQETQDALASQQAQLDEKASLESFDNLTQRVQENASAITEVRNATTPAALAGDGLIANTTTGKIDINPGAGLVKDSGQVKVDPDVLAAVNGAASQQQVDQLVYTVDLQQAAINNLQEKVVTAADLAGPGLLAQDGKLTPKIGAGLEVSPANLLQISAEFAAEVNGKANEADLLAMAEAVDSSAIAIRFLQNNVGVNTQAITDLQNDTPQISAQSAAIGTYALVANITATAINGNVVVPGSSLAFIGPVIYSNGSVTPSMGIGTSPAGSWRIMGWGLGGHGSGYAYAIGLAKRIA